MFGFLQGQAFERELHNIAIALSISPCGALTASRALNQAGILDAVSESMSDHLIVPIDEGCQLVFLPDQPAAIALLWRLEDKAQSGIVALVLDTREAPAFALKAHPAGLAYTDAIEG